MRADADPLFALLYAGEICEWPRPPVQDLGVRITARERKLRRQRKMEYRDFTGERQRRKARLAASSSTRLLP